MLKRLRALRLGVIHQTLFDRSRVSSAFLWRHIWLNSLAEALQLVQVMGCDSSGPAIGLMLPSSNIMCHEAEPLGPNCVGLISAVSEGLHTLRLWYVFPFVDQMIYGRTRTFAL